MAKAYQQQFDDGVVQPVMSGYKMECCDCSLVHDFDFQVVKVVKDFGDGRIEGKVVSPEKYRVRFTVRRNNRSTGQKRRHRK